MTGIRCCLLFLILRLGILTNAQVTDLFNATYVPCPYEFNLDATDSPQTLESPNYPGPYESNTDCSWMITAPQGVLNITVQFYDIENHVTCDYDSLTIYDETSSAVCSVTLCGYSNSPQEYITSSNEAFISFNSDMSIGGNGFVLTYQYTLGYINPTIPCEESADGDSIQDDSIDDNTNNGTCTPGSVNFLNATPSPQTISSTNFPWPYENNENCSWMIVADQGVIKITVLQYDIEYQSYCSYDSLTIYHGDQSGNSCTATLCGAVVSPQEYITSSSEAAIDFHSDRSVTFGGFSLTYQYVDENTPPTIPCNSQVPSSPTHGRCSHGVVDLHATSTPRFLESPNYPNPADFNQDCRWKINAPHGVIKITILNYAIEAGTSVCIYDSLSFFDGPSQDADCNVKLCGTSSEIEEYITTSNEAFIYFHTDYSETHDGWSLTYQYVDENASTGSQCPQLGPATSNIDKCPSLGDQILTATPTPQYIQSPNFPQSYDNNDECFWNIRASEGVISITVTSYDIEDQMNCSYDSLRIHDGNSSQSICTATLCGLSTSSLEYITSSDEALIHFHSDSNQVGNGFNIIYQQVDGNIAPTVACLPIAPSYPTQGRCVIDTVLLEATSAPQIIESPGYPSETDITQDCMWKISAHHGAIKITVQQYDIEYDSHCAYDSLHIHDGSSDRECSIQLCGVSSSPEEYITTSNEAFIHFHTDHSLMTPGFTLTYQYADSNATATEFCEEQAPAPTLLEN